MPEFKFNSQAASFDRLNALRLAEASELVYLPWSELGDCLQDEQGFRQYKFFDVHDTQAFLAANAAVVVLSFRGTETMSDWLTDLQVRLMPSRTGRVHFGFNQALEDIWYDLYDAICTWKTPEQTLWVTGHGLGGALATLAVDYLTDAGVEVAGLYTYGQPRVGNRDFASNFDRKMGRRTFRFINDEDVVTRMPLPPAYRHVGTQCFFDNQGRLCRDNFFWRRWRSIAESVSVRSMSTALRAKNPGGVSGHSLNYYLKYLRQACEQPTGSLLTFKAYFNRGTP